MTPDHSPGDIYCASLLLLVSIFLHHQPILKGLPGDTDRLEQSGVGEFIGRSAADAENILFIIPRMPAMSFIGSHSNLFGKQQILKDRHSFKPTAALWIFAD